MTSSTPDMGDALVTRLKSRTTLLRHGGYTGTADDVEEAAARIEELEKALTAARKWVVSFPVIEDTARQAMLGQIDTVLASSVLSESGND